MKTVFELHLHQHVTSPTRGNSMLDLIFLNDPELVANIDIIESLGEFDHNVILCKLHAKFWNMSISDRSQKKATI